MRLKIEIARRFFSDVRKDRTGDGAAVVLFGFGLGVVQNNQSNKFRTVRRQVAAEGNYFLALFVSAVRPNFLRGAGFTGNGESWNSGGRGGATIAHYASQRGA